MVLTSNAIRNKDIFTAILPAWKKYSHYIKDDNTIPNWNITYMTSVRFKLYEIMDLWDKARLLQGCSTHSFDLPTIPIFATHYDIDSLRLIEINNYEVAYENYKETLLNNIRIEYEEKDHIEQYIDDYKIKNEPIFTENLIHIQLNHYNDHSD